MIKKSILVLLVLFYCVPSYAKRGPWFPLNFLVGAIRYTPQVGPSSVFFQLGWTPIVEIGDWAIRGEFAFSSSRDENSKRFLTTNYELFGLVPLGSIFYFEAGGGMETWHTTSGGTNPIASLGMSARIGEFVDRLYLNLSFYLQEGNTTKIWRAGYCFNF